mmetsp:Transcript_7624/g.19777  ORF Transcript_7624/g.19777 Transcript_7624/m.19777 type:complete len:339 (-) Transcript_7624:2431-3447(-)
MEMSDDRLDEVSREHLQYWRDMIEEWEQRELTEQVVVPSRLEIEEPVVEGWLDRHEGVFKQWKKRWCMLKWKTLFVFRSSFDSDAIDVYPVLGAKVTTQEGKKTKDAIEAGVSSLTFSLVVEVKDCFGSAKVILWCPRFADLVQWQRALETAARGEEPDRANQSPSADVRASAANLSLSSSTSPPGVKPGILSYWKRYLSAYFRRDGKSMKDPSVAQHESSLSSSAAADAQPSKNGNEKALKKSRQIPISCRPPRLAAGIKKEGVPDCFRGIVWSRLCEAHSQVATVDYFSLVDMTVTSRDVERINKDIHRTFPGHFFFESMDGRGQVRCSSVHLQHF